MLPATNCTPCLDMARSNLSPPLSVNVTSLRSTTKFRPFSVRCVFRQLVLSSRTHGPTSRPCRIHFSSADVSVLVIFNTSTSFVWRIDSFACRQSGAVFGSVCRTEGKYFLGASRSILGWRVAAFRIWTSVLPHSKETSSMATLISQMPPLQSAPGLSTPAGSRTAFGSNPFPLSSASTPQCLGKNPHSVPPQHAVAHHRLPPSFTFLPFPNPLAPNSLSS